MSVIFFCFLSALKCLNELEGKGGGEQWLRVVTNFFYLLTPFLFFFTFFPVSFSFYFFLLSFFSLSFLPSLLFPPFFFFVFFLLTFFFPPFLFFLSFFLFLLFPPLHFFLCVDLLTHPLSIFSIIECRYLLIIGNLFSKKKIVNEPF